jgi:hypothetical protein
MAVRLTRNEIQLLKELSAGVHGRFITRLTSSAEIAHLMSTQYIKRQGRTKLYVITERGAKHSSRLRLGKDGLETVSRSADAPGAPVGPKPVEVPAEALI